MAEKVKPLKPKQRRLALRDPRLQPKEKDKRTPWWQRQKRDKVLTEEEANRLFGDTMRTRNREIRDLLPDLTQLKHYGLPPWKTEEELAEALGISLNELRFYAIHRRAEALSALRRLHAAQAFGRPASHHGPEAPPQGHPAPAWRLARPPPAGQRSFARLSRGQFRQDGCRTARRQADRVAPGFAGLLPFRDLRPRARPLDRPGLRLPRGHGLGGADDRSAAPADRGRGHDLSRPRRPAPLRAGSADESRPLQHDDAAAGSPARRPGRQVRLCLFALRGRPDLFRRRSRRRQQAAPPDGPDRPRRRFRDQRDQDAYLPQGRLPAQSPAWWSTR